MNVSNYIQTTLRSAIPIPLPIYREINIQSTTLTGCCRHTHTLTHTQSFRKWGRSLNTHRGTCESLNKWSWMPKWVVQRERETVKERKRYIYILPNQSAQRELLLLKCEPKADLPRYITRMWYTFKVVVTWIIYDPLTGFTCSGITYICNELLLPQNELGFSKSTYNQILLVNLQIAEEFVGKSKPAKNNFFSYLLPKTLSRNWLNTLTKYLLFTIIIIHYNYCNFLFKTNSI